MSRDPQLYLDDLQRACAKILRFTAGMTLSRLQSDERTYDAVVRNLEVIGEAAKLVPDQIRQATPQIDWRKITAMRNVLAHVYFGIDDDILWDVVQNKVPELMEALKPYRRDPSA